MMTHARNLVILPAHPEDFSKDKQEKKIRIPMNAKTKSINILPNGGLKPFTYDLCAVVSLVMHRDYSNMNGKLKDVLTSHISFNKKTYRNLM